MVMVVVGVGHDLGTRIEPESASWFFDLLVLLEPATDEDD